MITTKRQLYMNLFEHAIKDRAIVDNLRSMFTTDFIDTAMLDSYTELILDHISIDLGMSDYAHLYDVMSTYDLGWTDSGFLPDKLRDIVVYGTDADEMYYEAFNICVELLILIDKGEKNV